MQGANKSRAADQNHRPLINFGCLINFKEALAHDYFMEIDPETLWPEPMNYYQRMERMWCRLRKEYKPLSHRRLLVSCISQYLGQFRKHFACF